MNAYNFLINLHSYYFVPCLIAYFIVFLFTPLGVTPIWIITFCILLYIAAMHMAGMLLVSYLSLFLLICYHVIVATNLRRA